MLNMEIIPLDKKMVFDQIKPKPPDLHKGTAGKLFIVAGSRSFCGAAAMAVGGALRCGCGYVTLASTLYVCESAARHWVSPVYTILDETAQGGVSASNAEIILERARSSDALLVGCGLGNNEQTRELTESLLRAWDKPLILDADGINVVSSRISILKETRAQVLLTPHEGEMARLSGKTVADIHRRRPETAYDFARQYGVCVVLKGPQTIIASSNGMVLENSTGNSGLAKAGSGDILAGMIGSLAAQGAAVPWAAACGVYLHGAAADRTARRLSKFCMQPIDLLDDLPHIFLGAGR